MFVDLDFDRTVVSLALLCSFNRMRKHLNLGDIKPNQVSEDTVNAVAQVLRNSTSLKVSEDGSFFYPQLISAFCEKMQFYSITGKCGLL